MTFLIFPFLHYHVICYGLSRDLSSDTFFTVENNINVQFNTVPYHSRPLSINVAANILYKTLLPQGENNDTNSNNNIRVSFQPMVVSDEVIILRKCKTH